MAAGLYFLATHIDHPGLLMIIAGILVMLLPKKCRIPFALLGPVVAFISLMTLDVSSSMNYHITDFLTVKLTHYDGLSFAFTFTFILIAFIKSIYCLKTQDKREAGMALIYSGSMIGVVLAGDCISLIIAWELAAVASTYIVYAGHTRSSYRAAFRYCLVHAFGGNMFLVGLLVYVFHYGNELHNISDQIGTPMFWIMLIGVAVNAAIPPLNSWLSDAYPEASVTGTPYLASFTTKAAIYIMIRLFAGVEFLVWVGVFMALYAACMAIMENGVRRLLSYHIVSQLGMMVAALAVGSELGMDAATAHAVTNIFFKGVLMMCAGIIIYCTGKTFITELGGLGKKMPVVSTCFLICSLSIAGLPGTSGFVSKALISEALNEAGYGTAAILLVVAGVGTLLSITLKMNYYIFWGPCDEEAENLEIKKVPTCMSVAIILGTVVTLGIGFCPQYFYSLLPYETAVNPYALPHILEYLAIFVGGTIPFIIFVKKMRPHDDLTIDFDWFYRKPLNKFVVGLAKVLNRAFAWCENIAVGIARYFGIHLSNPYLWTEKSDSIRIRKMSFENEDHLIGDVISVVLFVIVLIIVLLAV